MGSLPLAARMFWATVVAAGLTVAFVAITLYHPLAQEFLLVAALIPAGAVCHFFQVRLPHARGTHSRDVTPSSAVYLAAIFLLPPGQAVLVPLAAYTTESLIRRTRPWYKDVFNAGQYAVSVGSASLLWRSWAPYPQAPQWPEHFLPMVVCGLTYLSLNTSITSSILALVQQRRFTEVWDLGNRSLLPSYIGMMSIGFLVALLWPTSPVVIPLIILPLAGIVLAFRNATQSEEQAARLRTLAHISQVVSSALDRQSVLDAVVQGALTLVGGREARLWLEKEGPANGLVLGAVASSPGHQPADYSPVIEARVVEVREKGAAVQAPTDRGEFLGVPVVLKDRRLGVLAVLTDGRQAATEDDLELMRSLASQAAIAIENARLFEEVGTVEALREMARLKSEFLSMVSHDLRTPLSVISGFAELLRSRDLTPEQSRAMAKEIYDAAEDMLRLVNDLLDSSRMEAGRFSLDRQPTDVGELLRSMVGTFAQSSNSHHFILELPPGLPLAQVDRERLRQVATNLISNAIRYSPNGGTITVRAGTADNRLWFEVEDQGIGISPEELPRIFDKFYRAKSALASGVSGTGLGLAIVKALVEAHGGEVKVRSILGVGTCFTVALPLT